MYRYESWTIKKAEHWRTGGAFELWCWRRLMWVPWTARRSNQSILKDINPEDSLEGLVLKLKLQYFSPDAKSWLIGRSWFWERLKARVEGDDRRWDGWMASCLSGHEFEQTQDIVKDKEVWHATVHSVTKSWTWLSNWTTTNFLVLESPTYNFFSPKLGWTALPVGS